MSPHYLPFLYAQVGAGRGGSLGVVGFAGAEDEIDGEDAGLIVKPAEVVGVEVEVLPREWYQMVLSSPRHAPTVTPVHPFFWTRSK